MIGLQRKAPTVPPVGAGMEQTHLRHHQACISTQVDPAPIVSLPATLPEQLILLRRRISTLINHLPVMDAGDVGLALYELAEQFCEISYPFVEESRQERLDNLAALATTMALVQDDPLITDQDLAGAAAAIRYERQLINILHGE